MEKEIVNTVKYSASVDTKFAKIALSLGLTKRMLFEKMVNYFFRTRKDPSDINDDLLKTSFAKSHKTYTSFIITQEQLLLIPMKEAMDRMISNQKDIVEIPINLTPSRQFQIDPQSCCLKQAEVVVQKGILE